LRGVSLAGAAVAANSDPTRYAGSIRQQHKLNDGNSESPMGASRQEFRMADGISLALAAAGAATAMRAASEATAEGETEDETEGETEGEKKTDGMAKFKVPLYIGLWYLFNIGYNIYNKKALITYPFPWACALWQMAFGWCIFVPLWLFGIRKVPKLTVKEAITLSPSALGHLATHVGAVIAFFAGAVSFGHIVKASEPVVSSLLNFLFMGETMAWPVYASLLPIIGGVGLASASEMSFNWLCFGAAMGSNIGSASRAVYSKKVMAGGNIGKNMDSSNIYAVLTIMATFMLIPISFAIEGPSAMLKGFHAAHAKGGAKFLWHMIYSGFFYYAYNEVAFLALGKLDPVSHAVSNTMKRVVIIITAIVVFGTKVTPLGVAGSSIAILGTLLYSLAKNKFK
jgi:solute carrier family 35 protein E1